MKVNGSLVFDASAASEIQNLRIEKVAALPTWASGDAGRIVYVTGTGIVHLGLANNTLGAAGWTPLATGGDASALLAEVNAVETALGLSADGTWNAAGFTGNLAGSTSLTNLVGTIQGLIATAQTTAAGAVSVNTTQTGLITGLRTDVDAATAANATQDTAITALQAADTATDTRIDGVEDDLADEVARATAAEGTLTTNLTAETNRATAAEGTLTTNLNNEIARATAAEGTLTTNLATEVTNRTTAVAGVQTALTNEVNRATAAEAALSAAQTAAAEGLAWKAPARAATLGNVDLAAPPTGFDGVTLANGDRVLVRAQTDAAENGIYVFNGAGNPMTRSLDMNAAGEFISATIFVREGTTFGDTGFTQVNDVATLNTDAVNFTQIAGAGAVQGGAGLTHSGNVINVGAGTGIQVNADTIEVAPALRTEISNATANIAAETAARTAADTAEATARANADTTLQGNIDAEATTRAGADTTLQNNINAEATARTNADNALGARIDDVEDDFAAGDATNAAAITAETSARTTADTALTNRINKMYFLYDDGAGAEAAAATSHVVTHNLGQSYCNVTVIANNEVVIPQSIVFNTANQLTITFNTALACRAVVMGLAAA